MRGRRLLDSFGYAWAGIAYAARNEPNLRVHLLISVGVVALGVWLGITALDWAVLALTIGFVLACELLNTGLEELVDLVSPEQSARAKAVKDTAAGAVMLAAVVSVVVGLLILGPPLWIRLFTSR